MHGDWTTTGVGDLDPTDEVVERRRRVVLENDLHGADLERLGEPLRGQRRAPSDGDPLRQRTAAYRVDQRTQVADAVVRCRVGDAGDPEAGQPSPDSAEIGHALEREHVSQPLVEPEQPSRRTARPSRSTPSAGQVEVVRSMKSSAVELRIHIEPLRC